MMKSLKILAMAAALLLITAAKAAGPIVGNGYFGSATWSTGAWPPEYVTHSVGPYLTYDDCYTAWMQLTHSNPQWWLESTVGCHLKSTHMAYVELTPYIIDDGNGNGNGNGNGGTFGSLDDLVDYAERVRNLRRQFDIDEFEAALSRLR